MREFIIVSAPAAIAFAALFWVIWKVGGVDE